MTARTGALVGEGGDGVDLSLERFGEHTAGAFADELVDQRGGDGALGRAAVTVGGVGDYGEHGCGFPADVGASAMRVRPQTITGKVRPFPADPQVSSIAFAPVLPAQDGMIGSRFPS
ncbi:hypothetical protein HS041_04450 [Planomonospora sp. ID67723]|uniref:hypothetical protein n=1 Tax=Planomonospora sp. ID67723 TaxID=2738134 RepID=UPI0018C3997C|nr:hypothetical protein [Planomonospora sp. ID67723]MBG0827013.1 hypothetical protein [Planomonospora sp. ID67723]